MGIISKLKKSRVVLYGADLIGESALGYLISNDIQPIFIVDKQLFGKYIYANNQVFIVQAPDTLLKETSSDIITVIAVSYPLSNDISIWLSENQLNHCFYTKDIVTCDLLQHHLGFYNDMIGFCCGAHNSFHKKMPRYPYLESPEETIKNILDQRESIIKGLNGIQDRDAATNCAKCPRLFTMPHHISDIGYGVEKLNLINISCYPSFCQAKCIFCGVPNNPANSYKESQKSQYPKMITQMIEYLRKDNLLSEDCLFQFATAEITITPSKDILLSATSAYDGCFLTNGIIFDEQIAQSLTRKGSELRISLDSGTANTFKMVKGVNLFHEVLKNLKKYRSFGLIEMKYNVLPGINDSKPDYDGIVDIMLDLNLKYVRISFDYELPLRTSIYSIIKLIRALAKKNIGFVFHVYYTAEEILSIIDKHESESLQKYYESKVDDLRQYYQVTNDYALYRNYVYLKEVECFLALLDRDVSINYIYNDKNSKGKKVKDAFIAQNNAIQVMTFQAMNAFTRDQIDSTALFVVFDEKQILNTEVLLMLKKEKRVLDIEKYFYSFEPASEYLAATIASKFLRNSQCNNIQGIADQKMRKNI